jgi:CRP/FNR family cyclic AMP-dependent transcriptional regulator
MKMKVSDQQALITRISEEGTAISCRKGKVIFSQGDPSDAVFSIVKGRVKLAVLSTQNKEGVLAILNGGDLIGEACLLGQNTTRMATASAITECTIVRLARPAIMRLLREDAVFSSLILRYVLARNIRIEEDLIDHLFNSSEKRLARMLLLLANFGKDGKPEMVPQVSQETLAGLIGTTRSRVSFFMNKFRRLGFIDYNGGLKIHSSLLSVVLHD